jgi:uncharacterized LabA/DUF88 family protein
MLNTQQTLIPFTLASLISFFGVCSHQPSIIGAGAGLAGGIGSARLAQSRQKDSKTLDMLQEMDEARFTKIGKALDTVIAKDELQSGRIEQLSNDSNDIKQIVEQLNKQLQIQKTTLNLQTKSIQKLQQDNHTNRAIVAVKDKEITDCQSKIEQLTNDLASRPERDEAAPQIPTTHLLIDGNALRFVSKNLGIEIDYQALRAVLTQGAERVVSKYYIGDAKSSKHKRLVKHLQEQLDFEVSLFPIINVGANRITTKGDDVAMALDAVKNASPGDTVVLVLGGDGDFAPVIRTLKQMNVNVTVASYIKTTSWVLKKEVGKNLIDLKSLICANESASEAVVSEELVLA